MTTTIKRFITVILTVATFAVMTTSAFAWDVNDINRDCCRHLASRCLGEDYAWADAEIHNAYENVVITIEDRACLEKPFTGTLYITRALALKQHIPSHRNHAVCEEMLNNGYVSAYEWLDEKAHIKSRSDDSIGYLNGDYQTFHGYSRQDFAVSLFRAAKFAGMTEDEEVADITVNDLHYVFPGYRDGQNYTSEEAKEAVQFVVNHGFMLLDANGKFNPNRDLNMFESVFGANRLYKAIPTSDAFPFDDATARAVKCHEPIV